MIIHLQEICGLFSKYNQLWYSVKSINHTMKSIIHKLKSLNNEKYSDEWH